MKLSLNKIYNERGSDKVARTAASNTVFNSFCMVMLCLGVFFNFTQIQQDKKLSIIKTAITPQDALEIEDLHKKISSLRKSIVTNSLYNNVLSRKVFENNKQLTKLKYIPTTLKNAAVEIRTKKGQGSGVVIYAGKGLSYIITAAHVVSYSDIIPDSNNIPQRVAVPYKFVKLGVKNNKNILAKIVEINFKSDLAILKVAKNLNVTPIVIASQTPEQGEVVWAIANPSGFVRSFLKGVFSHSGKFTNMIILNGVFGSSGGMIVNTEGELFGIVSTIAIIKINNKYPNITAYNNTPKLKEIQNIINKVLNYEKNIKKRFITTVKS